MTQSVSVTSQRVSADATTHTQRHRPLSVSVRIPRRLPASGPDGAERRSPSSPAPRWLLGCRSAAMRRCHFRSVICSASIAVRSSQCDDGCVARSRRALCCCRRCRRRSRCRARAAERRALKGFAASQVNKHYHPLQSLGCTVCTLASIPDCAVVSGFSFHF